MAKIKVIYELIKDSSLSHKKISILFGLYKTGIYDLLKSDIKHYIDDSLDDDMEFGKHFL